MSASYKIKSMTGYGRAQRDTERGQFLVEIKSVNNRFVDLNLALPRELNVLENALRALFKQQIARGKVDVRIRYTPAESELPKVTLNETVALQYIERLRRLGELGAGGDVPIALVAGMPGVMETATAEIDEQAMLECLRPAIDQALETLEQERSREGLAIGEQLKALAGELRAELAELEQHTGGIAGRMREKLMQRIGELLAGAKDHIDPGRIEQEAAMLADRADIMEEIVRLRTHIDRYEALLINKAGEPVGKNVDFLLQEFGREINTICSKTREAELTAIGLNMKSIAEKMREQIQNVE